MRVVYIRAIARMIRTAGCKSVIGTTSVMMYNFRPIAAGVDLVLLAASTYLGGDQYVLATLSPGTPSWWGRYARCKSRCVESSALTAQCCLAAG